MTDTTAEVEEQVEPGTSLDDDDAEAAELAEPGADVEPGSGDGEPDGESEASAAHDEQWWEQVGEKIRRENERHRKRVEDLLEEEVVNFARCPVCEDAPDGYYIPHTFDDEEKAAVLTALDLVQQPAYKVHDDFVECEGCEGWGQVITGSKVVGNETAPCPKCGGSGFQHRSGAPIAQPPPAPASIAADAQPQVDIEQPDYDPWMRPKGHPHFNRPPSEVY